MIERTEWDDLGCKSIATTQANTILTVVKTPGLGWSWKSYNDRHRCFEASGSAASRDRAKHLAKEAAKRIEFSPRVRSK